MTEKKKTTGKKKPVIKRDTVPVPKAWEPDKNISEHFTFSEFMCHNGEYPPVKKQNNINDTLEFLEKLRGFCNLFAFAKTGRWKNIGLKIVSGYRTVPYEKQHGRSGTSRHTEFTAVDVRPVCGYTFFSYDEFVVMAEIVDNDCFPDRAYRIGTYKKSESKYGKNNVWIHVDCSYGYGGTRWAGK